jgi:non-ribosomal peptide synthetase-like protein
MATTEDTTGWRPLAEPQPALEAIHADRSTLPDVLAATAARHPGAVALDAPDGRLTYAALVLAAEQLADRLGAAGVGAGERVGVRIASGGCELYVAILGVLWAGAAYVPVDADDPPARANAIWEEADVCGVLGDDLRYDASRPPCLLPATDATGADRDRDRDGSAAHAAIDGDADAWIIFTSGSTGRPKGVAVSHRSAVAFIAAEARLWTISPEDRVLAGLSVSFDASCEEMWLAWANGAALVPAPRALVRSGVDLGPWLCERGVSVVSTVPTLASMWEPSALAGVRLLILGGEACPPELGWRLAGEREVWNTYGPTEATVVSTAARVRPGEPVTIGWPLHGWRVAVVDGRGRPVGFGDPGELAIAGVGLARYLDPRLDAKRYAPLPALGWARAYRTGDIVRETVDGYEFVGRADDQVKLGGRRLELGEVEAQLLSASGVRAAAAAVQSAAGGNRILVGYVVGEVDPARVREQVAEQLPDGIAPSIVVLEKLPTSTSGKVDRRALPWPAPGAPGGPGVRSGGPDGSDTTGAIDPTLDPTAAWLAARVVDQLGPVPIGIDSDLFALGASSTIVAKLVSALRERYPAVAVADVYEHRTLGALADRLRALGEPASQADRERFGALAIPRRLGAMQVAGVLVLTALSSIQWVIAVLAYGHIEPEGLPQVGWAWLIGAWLLLCSPPARLAIAVLARRALLPQGIAPGRYPRDSWLTARIWFLERLGEHCRLTRVAGTPWAARWARRPGARIGEEARLGSMPTLTSLVRIDASATIEPGVDLHGWWIDGQELVIGDIHVGAGASVGSRTLLAPGARVGAGAEIEPGSVITGAVPAGERWGGSPARALGAAGADWPAHAPAADPRARRWRAMFTLGLVTEALLALLAIAPAVGVLVALGAPAPSLSCPPGVLLAEAALFAVLGTVTLALLIALALRLTWRLVRPGDHGDDGAVAWALWFSGDLQESAAAVLFSLYASLYTRTWLRLAGLRIGRRTELSTSTGLSPLVSFGELSHATDDVGYCAARARGGWLRLEPIAVGSRTFLGPGAILREGTRLGDDSLLGALTLSPRAPAPGTSWFGVPALELPRTREAANPSLTTSPSRGRVAARATMDLIRIFLPNTISVVVGLIDFLALGLLGARLGVAAMVLLAPLVVLVSGLFSTVVAVAVKWLVIGRYRPSRHPLWSAFVWRDELVNSMHEQLAGEWLLRFALGSPLMSLYLRAMGARIGRGVWCETTAITEYDLVRLDDGAAVNRGACLMTHVFQDRLLSIGPTHVGASATLAPTSAVLPDTAVGAGTCIGEHAVVLRGEHLPPGTRWRGAPVRAA